METNDEKMEIEEFENLTRKQNRIKSKHQAGKKGFNHIKRMSQGELNHQKFEESRKMKILVQMELE